MTLRFPLDRLELYVGSSVTIRRPREIAHFSFNDQHELRPLSTESLSYYYPPLFNAPGTQAPPTNLSAGFDSFVQRDDSIDEHLDALLDTLQAHEERLLQAVEDGEGKIEEVRSKADFVTWRGMMTKVWKTSP